jgi:hypothetical protein
MQSRQFGRDRIWSEHGHPVRPHLISSEYQIEWLYWYLQFFYQLGDPLIRDIAQKMQRHVQRFWFDHGSAMWPGPGVAHRLQSVLGFLIRPERQI